MATIVEHIFSYQLDNVGVPRPSVDRILAHSATAKCIWVSWHETPSINTFNVQFEYIKEDCTFDPVSSPSKMLGMGEKVEPRSYTCTEFMDLIKDASFIRFKYHAVADFVRPEEFADEYVSYHPNYSHFITVLEKKGIVKTSASRSVFCEDPRRFSIVGETQSYDVDYLGTGLCPDLSQRIETLYSSSQGSLATPLKS